MVNKDATEEDPFEFNRQHAVHLTARSLPLIQRRTYPFGQIMLLRSVAFYTPQQLFDWIQSDRRVKKRKRRGAKASDTLCSHLPSINPSDAIEQLALLKTLNWGPQLDNWRVALKESDYKIVHPRSLRFFRRCIFEECAEAVYCLLVGPLYLITRPLQVVASTAAFSGYMMLYGSNAQVPGPLSGPPSWIQSHKDMMVKTGNILHDLVVLVLRAANKASRGFLQVAPSLSRPNPYINRQIYRSTPKHCQDWPVMRYLTNLSCQDPSPHLLSNLASFAPQLRSCRFEDFGGRSLG